ncbi:hypothetical protein ACFC1L_39760 [Streptomyces sp. NPDC056210]|uniref:hypothetical protein n=1 Tax=Streptomyces sp. NPDC056210 TaxID=3345746 RepID=UPI0035D930ED
MKEIRLLITSDLYDDDTIGWVEEDVAAAVRRYLYKGDFTITTIDLMEVPNA